MRFSNEERREYMRSPEWLEIRKHVIGKFNKTCQLCGLECHDGNGLNVHHMTYARLGNEDVDNDLTLLCESCHETVTNATRELKRDRKAYLGMERWRKNNPDEKDVYYWSRTEAERKCECINTLMREDVSLGGNRWLCGADNIKTFSKIFDIDPAVDFVQTAFGHMHPWAWAEHMKSGGCGRNWLIDHGFSPNWVSKSADKVSQHRGIKPSNIDAAICYFHMGKTPASAEGFEWVNHGREGRWVVTADISAKGPEFKVRFLPAIRYADTDEPGWWRI